ncbi:MAG: zinc-ribbon domain containing protein [Thermomicrobiales bacterium]
MSERTLTCRDCGQEFVFTLGEQEFYAQRGFSEPQRCPSCRQARKAQRNAGGGGYDSYGSSSNGGGYSSGGGSYGGGRERSYDSAPRQLYPATCSECGQPTEVPFNPSPGKPVYCRECYQAKRQSTSYNRW